MPTTNPPSNWQDWLALIARVLIIIFGAGTVSYVASTRGCKPPPSPPTHQDPPENPPDAINAIGRIAMSRGYCSGTVVSPRLPNGRWTIVSASHCFDRVGEEATFIPRKGSSFRVQVQAIDRRSDIAILNTVDSHTSLAYTTVAEATPPAGTPVLHAGFGVDKPGNVERGQILAGPNEAQQVRYRISVSPGDSGGGICITEKGHLLSPVCCTTCLGCTGDVWGGSPERIRVMIANPTAFIDLPPVPMPAPPKDTK